MCIMCSGSLPQGASRRLHTSSVTIVQVLPLMEETDEQNDELFSMDEIRIEVVCTPGAGGQVGF